MANNLDFLNPNINNIPKGLKDLNQWVVWKAEHKNGKWTKVPYNPHTKKNAKVNDPKSWSNYETAINCYKESNGFDGIGFVLTVNDPFIGWDLDKCRDGKTGEIEKWAQKIINCMNSYSETSPTGTGIRIFAKGSLPKTGRKKGNIEVYETGRYLTLTGHHLPGAAKTIEKRQDEVNALHSEIFKSKKTFEKKEEPLFQPANLDDQALLQKAFESKNGDKIRKLYNGNWKGYPSQSEADLALCGYLVDWLGPDPKIIDRNFRKSGLYRKKWDERHSSEGLTYGEMTIRTATSSSMKTYQEQRRNNGKFKSFMRTDLGNAERMVAMHGQNIKFCKIWGKWLIWDGKRWAIDDIAQIMQLAKKTVRNIYKEVADAESKDKRKEIFNHAIKSEAEPRLKAMIKLAESEKGIPIRPEELDSDPLLFNVENGTIDLRTGQLKKHNREHLITKIAPVKLDKTSTATKWEMFLERIMNENKNLINFLKRIIGYSLTGNTDAQCLFFLYGAGHNGKSTFLETIRGLLGDYGKTSDFNTFLKTNNQSIRNDIARLKGSRFVSAIEADSGKKLAETLIKRITGGDTILARFLYREHFEFKPTFKIFMAANHKPIIEGVDEAIWRRIKLIPFDVTIPIKDKDAQLGEKLKSELSGLLNWALEGCLEWQKNGLGIPEDVIGATEKYREEMDLVRRFISECCINNSLAKVNSTQLKEEFTKWLKRIGEDPVSQKDFRIRLKDCGYINKRTNKGYFWQGIGLKDFRNREVNVVNTGEREKGESPIKLPHM